jgi:predicted N-acetyltransferase YhbS
MEIEPFRSQHASAIAAMCSAEGWESWDDVDAVERALSAPGVWTLVAVDGREVVGAAQVLSDGQINWMLGALNVARGHRRRGIGRRLVDEAFARTGARRLDLLTEDEGPSFYRRLEGREMKGFRLYPARS